MKERQVSSLEQSPESWSTFKKVLFGGNIAIGLSAVVLFTLAAFAAGSFLTFGILPVAFIGAAIITVAAFVVWNFCCAIYYAHENRNKEILKKPDDIYIPINFPTNVPSVEETVKRTVAPNPQTNQSGSLYVLFDLPIIDVFTPSLVDRFFRKTPSLTDRLNQHLSGNLRRSYGDMVSHGIFAEFSAAQTELQKTPDDIIKNRIILEIKENDGNYSYRVVCPKSEPTYSFSLNDTDRFSKAMGGVINAAFQTYEEELKKTPSLHH